MHPFALLMTLGAQASLDTLTVPSQDAQIVTAYADATLAPLVEPADQERGTTLRLGAVSINATQAATDDHAHAALSRLLRQRAVHLEHCAQHAPSDTSLQIDLTFAAPPLLQAPAAPGLATCLQSLAERWPVPTALHGTRATLRLVSEGHSTP